MKQAINRWAVVLLALLPMAAGAQSITLADYTFSTGVDASKWFTITSTTNLCTEDVGDYAYTPLQTLPFTFPFGGSSYTQWSASGDGLLCLGSTLVDPGSGSQYSDVTFSSGNIADGAPKIAGYAHDGSCGSASGHYIYGQSFADTVYVIEFSVGTDWNNGGTAKWQVQLFAKGDVRLVYGTSTGSYDFQIGMCASATDLWLVSTSHTATHYTAGNSTTVDEWPGANRYYHFAAPFICLPPAGVTASSINSSGYTLSWTATDGASKYIVYNNLTPHVTTSTSYTQTGLAACQGDYTVGVAAVCGSDTSAPSTQIININGGSSVMEDFDSYTGTGVSTGSGWEQMQGSYSTRSLPTGWYFPNNYMGDSPSDANNPNIWLSQAVDGTYGNGQNVPGSVTHLEYKTTGKRAVAALPLLGSPANDLSIRFKFQLEQSSTEFRLGIMTRLDGTDDENIASIVILKTWTTSGQWVQVDEALGDLLSTTYAGGTYRITLEYWNPSTGAGYRAYMDEVELGTEQCTAPTDLTITNKTTTSLRLGWSSAAPSSATYTIFVNGNEYATTAAGATYQDISGLSPLTRYTLGVRTNCVACEQNSRTSSARTRMLCTGTVDAPYSENFDFYSIGVATSTTPPATYPAHTVPSCWTLTGISSSTSTYPQIFLSTANAHATNALMFINGAASNVSYAVLPRVSTTDIAHLRLDFWYRNSATATTCGQFTIGTMTDAGNASTFTPLHTLDRVTSWTRIQDTLGIYDPSASARYIAIRYSGGSSSAQWSAIDSVRITTLSCLPVSNLSATDITTSGFRVTWNEHNGTATYTVSINDVNHTTAAGATSYTASGLPKGSACKVVVTPSCGGDSRTAYLFTACDDGVSLPYSETFDYYGGAISTGTGAPTGYPSHTLPNCWQFLGLSTSTSTYPQAFITNNSTYRVSGQGLLFRAANTDNPLYAVLPLPEGTTPTAHLKLSFAYKSSVVTATAGRLVYGVMANPSNASSFVPLDTVDLTTAWTTIECAIGSRSLYTASFSSTDRPHVAFKYVGGAANTGYTAIDNVKLEVVCSGGLTASGITTSGCTLTWSDFSGGAYPYAVYDGSTLLATTATGATSYVASLSGGLHTIKVKASCSPCDCEEMTVNVMIPCSGTLPYSENFDGVAGTTSTSTSAPSGYAAGTHGKPDCWYFPGMSTTTSTYPQVFIYSGSSSTYRYSGKSMLFKICNNTSAKGIAAIVKQFGVPTSGLTMSFRYKVTNATYGKMQWGYVTDPEDPSTFVAVGSGTATSWTQTTINYSTASGVPSTECYPAFCFTNSRASSVYTYYGGLDEITITQSAPCAVPSLTASNVGSSTATLTWADPYNSGYTYTVKNSSTTLGTTAATTYSLTGLAANTAYTITVEASCGSSNSVSFTTECDPSLPYTENFDGITGNVATGNNNTVPTGYPNTHAKPSCWRFHNIDNSHAWAYLSSYSAHIKTGKAMFLRSDAATPIYMVLPNFSTAHASHLKLTFDYKHKSNTTSSGILSYGVMTDPDDPSTYINIASLPRTNNAWENVSDMLGTHIILPSSPLYVAFRYEGGTSNSYSYATCLENINIEAINCLPPTDLAASVTPASATLTWTDFNGGATYQVYQNGTLINTTAAGASSYTVSGLTSGATYTFSVKAVCSGSTTSDEVSTTVMIPCDGSAALPYTENFDSYSGNSTSTSNPTGYPNHTKPTCWAFPGMSTSTSGYPRIFLTNNSSYRVSGNGLLFLGNTTSSVNYPGVAVVAQDFGIASSSMGFSFKYKVSSSYYGRIDYGVVTNPGDSNTFIRLGGTTSTSWVTITDTLSKHTGLPSGTLYLAFRFSKFNSTSTSTYYGALDDVNIYQVVNNTCLATTSTFTHSACDSYTWLDGVTYTSSTNTPTYVTTNSCGADSTITLNLTIRQSSTGDTTAQGFTTYTWHGITYTSTPATPPTDHYTNAAGCDSTVTLHLTIHTPCASTLPYSENFDSYSGSNNISTNSYPPSSYPSHALPSCWYFPYISATSSTYPQVFLSNHSDYKVSGNGLAFISKPPQRNAYAVIAKQFNAPNSRLEFSFQYRVFNTTYDRRIHYGYMTNPDDTTTFVSLGNTNSNTFVSVTDTLAKHAALPSGTIYLAFRFTHEDASRRGGAVDNVLIRRWCDSTTTTTTACDSYTWSETSTTYTSSGIYRKVYENANGGCDSVVRLNLTINHSTAYTDSRTECDYYRWIDNNVYFTSTSTPTYTLHNGNAAGCDSTITLNLSIITSTNADTIAYACDHFTWYGITYTETDPAVATRIIPNAAGCDSIIALNLTVGRSNTGDTSATACNQFTWYNTSYTTTSNPTHTFTNATACDSVVTLHLTINNSNTGDTTAVECNQFTWHGISYTSTPLVAPTYTHTNAAGCDSVVTLHLTINHSNTGDTTAVECDQFTWHGTTYTTTPATSPTYTYANHLGCDSVVTLHLTINHSNTGDTTAVECNQFTWHGTTYTTTPTIAPTYTYTNHLGCDSVVTLHLTINNSNTGDTTAVECSQFTWHGTTYNTTPATAPTYTHTNHLGCDSVVTLHLTINHSNTGDTTAVKCDNFTWHGTTYTTTPATSPTYTHANHLGCDSIVTLHLTINHSNTGDTTAVKCDNFTWHGTTYTTTPATSPTYTHTNAAGCDSVVTLHLTVNHSNTGDTTAVECDQFTWHGTTYTTTPTLAPTYTYTNRLGCDSVVTLHLTINHSSTGDTTAAVCDNFTWHGTTYTTTPTTAPTYTHINAAGCDSIVTLHLTVNHSNTGDTTATACDNFTWHGNTYTTTPTTAPTYTHTNAAGCDSVVTLHLTINHSNIGDTFAVKCDNFTWYGTTYTATPATAPTYTHTNATGCDSVVTLHLTINHSNTGDTTAVECNQFTWHGNTYTATPANAPIYNHTNAANCDSIVTLHLTINNSNTGDTTAVECNQFTWHGTTYTATPTIAPTYTHTNAAGCDSVVTLHLTINYSNTGDTTAVKCDNFTWHGTTYTTTPATAPTYTHTNAAGCDSVVTLHLTINYSNTGDTMAVKCDNFTWHGITYTTTPTTAPTYTHTNATGCDSVVTLHLTINYSNAGDTFAVKCDNFTWHSTTYTTTPTTAPTYTHTNATGCDSVVTLHLTINSSSRGDTTAVKCDNFTWHGTTYTTTPVTAPTYTHTNYLGCDSVVTLHLTINSSNTGDTTTTACDNFTWHGNTYTTTPPVAPTFTYINAAGCDSVVTLHLTINNSNTGDTTAVECDQFTWHGTTYTTTPTTAPTYTHTNAANCDSVVTLHLTVNLSTRGDTTATACDSLLWHGTTYTTTPATAPTHTYTNIAACDSVVTLHLTVNHSTRGDTTATACDSLLWHGTTYTTSGDFNSQFQILNSHGCDSTVTLHLTLHRSTTADTFATANDSLLWHGLTYLLSGDYPYHSTNAAGCDSLTTLHLTIRNSTTSHEFLTACDSLLWKGQIRRTSGTYRFDTLNLAGADSTIFLHLTINRSTHGDTTALTCDSLLWHGTTYTTGGDFNSHFSLLNSNGCDSTVTLHLTLHHSTRGDTTATACNQFTWHGINYTASGDFNSQFPILNSQSCDSLVTLHLTINRSTHGDTTAVACDSLIWHGTAYTTSGDFNSQFQILNSNGCDSTVTLHLTIHTAPNTSLTDTACSIYTWVAPGDGHSYTASGTYLFSYNDGNSCPRTDTIHLTILRPNHMAFWPVACDSFYWAGFTNQTYTSSGIYTHYHRDTNGCMQVDTLYLTIQNNVLADTTAIVCDRFTWHGTTYTAVPPAPPTHTYISHFGCDSTVRLHLTIRHSTSGDTSASACDRFIWHGTDYTTSGTFTSQFSILNSQGCDSIVTLHLTIHPSTRSNQTVNAIASYTWHDSTYTLSGTYRFDTLNAHGCDSTAFLRLFISPFILYHDITIRSADPATGTTTPNGTIQMADSHYVTATATPTAGHRFTAWRRPDGSLVSTDNPYSFLATHPDTLIAHFRNVQGLDSVVVCISINAASMGITNPAPGLHTYFVGDHLSAQALATGGYSFEGWTATGHFGYLPSTTFSLDITPDLVGSIFYLQANFTDTPLGLRSTDAPGLTIRTDGATIHVSGAEGRDLMLYDVNGRLLSHLTHAPADALLTAPASGVYLIKATDLPAVRIVVIK